MNNAKPQQHSNGQMLDSKQLLNIILRRKWLLIICIMVFFFIGWVYTALRTPIYQSNMLIQVNNNQNPSGGNGAAGPSVIIFGQNSAAQSEASIIPSRGVLSAAANKLNLNVIATLVQDDLEIDRRSAGRCMYDRLVLNHKPLRWR